MVKIVNHFPSTVVSPSMVSNTDEVGLHLQFVILISTHSDEGLLSSGIPLTCYQKVGKKKSHDMT